GQAAAGGRGSSTPLVEVLPTQAEMFRFARPPARASSRLSPLVRGTIKVTYFSIPESIAIDTVFANFVIDDAFRGAQHARRFRSIAARGLQRIHDDVFLIRSDSFSESERRDSARGLGRLKSGWQVMAVNDIAVANQDGTLHDVFEFANVARPMIGREHIDC